MEPTNTPPTVFVSYSRKEDPKWIELLKTHLTPLVREEDIDLWIDTRIDTGDHWREEIDQALARASAAVLLVSPDFLASAFIHKVELSALLEAAKGRGLRIFTMILRPCTMDPRLARFQHCNDPKKPLAKCRKVGQDEAFVKLTNELRTFLETPQPSPANQDEGFTRYRSWALENYGRLELIGIGGSDLHLGLERVYVPLRIGQRSLLADLDHRSEKPRRQLADEAMDQEIALEACFQHARDGRVLIQGEPGAGKTTALRKLLHLCLSPGAKPPEPLPNDTLPLFLRLRHFTPDLLECPLHEYLQRELDLQSSSNFPGLAQRLWERGRLLFLFDGLDEIADDDLRAKTAAWITHRLRGEGQRRLYAAVSCRYAGYGGSVRLPGFLPLDVRPLDRDQVRQFVGLWFDEACQVRFPVQPERAIHESTQGVRRITEALEGGAYANQRLLVAVANPLLLSLLCLVVLEGGQLPRNRSDFYRRCLEVLLTRWRCDTEHPPLLELDLALAILRPLAYRLKRQERKYNLHRFELIDFAEDRLAQEHGRRRRPARLASPPRRIAGGVCPQPILPSSATWKPM